MIKRLKRFVDQNASRCPRCGERFVEGNPVVQTQTGGKYNPEIHRECLSAYELKKAMADPLALFMTWNN